MIPLVQPPKDSFSSLEKIFLKDLLVSIYRMIPDVCSKFIMVAYFECGYSQEDIANMLGISQVAVNKRIKKTQDRLKKNGTKQEIMSSLL